MSEDDSDDNLLLQIPDEMAGPEESLMDQVLDEKLQAALNSLPEVFRTAVLLCDVHGKSYDEIAVIMGSSIGTVRSRIHRGRTILRRLMAGKESSGIRSQRKPVRRSAPFNSPLAPAA